MNLRHLALIPTLVMALTYGGAVDTQIVVSTPYKGQLHLLRKLLAPAITIATVDSSQGKEYDFVILDLVNPGGALYSLGFLTDLNRPNVALSRARMGLLIIGDKNMSDVPHRAAGPRGWEKLIGAHADCNAVVQWDGSNHVGELMRELRIPGNDYENVRIRGYTYDYPT